MSNAVWSYRQMLRGTPASFFVMAAGVPLGVLLAWAELRLPALVVSEVTGGQTFLHAALAAGALLALTFLAVGLRDFCKTILEAQESRYRFYLTSCLEGKSMAMFYQTYEKKQTRDLRKRAEEASYMMNGKVPLCQVPNLMTELIRNALCYALFGTILSRISPLLLVLLTLAALVNLLCVRAYNRYEYASRGERTDIGRRLRYVSKNAADFAAAKDIRIYGMATWLRETFSDLFRQDTAWSARLNRRLFLGRLVDLLVILLRDGGAYALLLVMAVRGELRPDEFVLYFSAISGFATFIGNMISAWNEMQTASLKVSDYRQFMELPDTDGTGTAHAADHREHAPEITFDHVSFRYDGAAHDTLHDISLTLRAGEHVALVGLNGAGKTTLVKLLCGLYAPTSGTIRIDGVPAAEFRRDDYAALFAPVFQEVRTACFSLAETAACAFGPEVDRERAERCLRAAGLGEKLDALPHGMDTHLDKQVNPDGIELSGGEAQKLMMARALYKDAPVLVLDEPTAALDPIAENEVYEQYRRMAAGKTSLFISHRLASTRFCDRIVLLRDGGIAEEGTHETLLAAGGEYARLYEIQSCWYQPGYQGGKQA